MDVTNLFPTEDAAREWFEEVRWGGEPVCAKCGSLNVQSGAKHPSMTHRCRDCRKFFSVKTDTAMQSSKLGLRIWGIAIYLLSTELQGRASMNLHRLHRDLGISRKAAWHLAHRLREAWDDGRVNLFSGPVEVDETYVGGLGKNKHAKDKLNAGRGPVGKTAGVGAKDRETNRVAARAIESVDGDTLNIFVDSHTNREAEVYTDGSTAYKGRENHEAVAHSAGEYVRYLEGKTVYTNGMESFRSMLKRAHKGTFHRLPLKHFQRYVNEFFGRHNVRELDTIDQMRLMAKELEGKRLWFRDLTA